MPHGFKAFKKVRQENSTLASAIPESTVHEDNDTCLNFLDFPVHCLEPSTSQSHTTGMDPRRNSSRLGSNLSQLMASWLMNWQRASCRKVLPDWQSSQGMVNCLVERESQRKELSHLVPCHMHMTDLRRDPKTLAVGFSLWSSR